MEGMKLDPQINSAITTIIGMLKEKKGKLLLSEIKEMRKELCLLLDREEFMVKVKQNMDLHFDTKSKTFMLPIHKEIYDEKSLDRYFETSWENKECLYEDEVKFAYPKIDQDINRKKTDKSIIAIESKADKRTVLFGRKKCPVADDILSNLTEDDIALLRGKWDKLRHVAA